jgi:transposase-like protein
MLLSSGQEENSMSRNRRNFSGQEKLAILREHLIEKVPISEVCDKHGVQPTLFYAWQKKLFEEGAAVFDGPKGRPKRQEDAQALRIRALETKLKQKNDVMAELLEEHIQLKKELGEL